MLRIAFVRADVLRRASGRLVSGQCIERLIAFVTGSAEIEWVWLEVNGKDGFDGHLWPGDPAVGDLEFSC